MYISPISTFLITRAIVQGSHAPDPTPTSVLPVVFGCGFAAALILLVCIPIRLSIDHKKNPVFQDRFSLFFHVVQLHMFVILMVSEILKVPQWLFIVLCLLCYPITHTVMHLQLTALAAEGGFFFAISDFFLCLMKRGKPSRTQSQSPTDLEAGDTLNEARTEFDAELELLEAEQSGIMGFEGPSNAERKEKQPLRSPSSVQAAVQASPEAGLPRK
ncbi:hypothetical protein GALMADRAFT_153472 [Galerina marginata CBS 339.88]|uniref:Uncharacterized protein n=1 Tax=Galerina marginata (strain CBS 339.88) TaxID=685588 RepID=A0A067TDD7_GALM3|nr:hypothetical protein GALMADRAFT_153472 [Galerina marginata CBS 339.88]